MPQLLLELFSEEIPARMQAQAARDLERMARDGLGKAGLISEGLKAFAGPRRLTLVVEGLPVAQPDVHEELKGPKANAPEQALEGFLRKTGLTREQLVEKDGVLFAHVHKAGRPTSEIIAELVEQIVRGFPWPKSMTWGHGKLRWVRPLKRILCVFNREVVPLTIDGIVAGDLSEGHRFMAETRVFRARDFDEYHEALAGHFVVLDVEERKQRILEGARTLCFARGLELVEDEGLLDEVAGLAEWPTPILGDMDPAFQDLPPEVIRPSMRTHQKYFAVRKPGEAGLAPHFLVVANNVAPDGGLEIARGNAKVLSSRLSDARFFWAEDVKDVKDGFEPWLKKLEGVTFHAKLGTMAERVERIVALAREIAPLVGAEPDRAAEAARLAKADLASQMVGEFPELQGIMGGYYARNLIASFDTPTSSAAQDDVGGEAQKSSHPEQARSAVSKDAVTLDAEIADAIRDHYRPQGPGDAVPTAPLSVAVALADKLDMFAGFWGINEKPTGSKDPFALRRAALGFIRLVLENDVRLRLRAFGNQVIDLRRKLGDGFGDPMFVRQFAAENVESFLDFLADRLKVLLRDQGKRGDLVDAVFALGDDDLVRIVARVEALTTFLATEDGTNLLQGYKRAANILKAEEKKGPLPTGEPSRVAEPAEEGALFDALAALGPKLDAALAVEDFTGAMTALAALRAPVDAFFDKVLVNSDVPAERDNRLRLLQQVQSAMGRVADFSLVTG